MIRSVVSPDKIMPFESPPADPMNREGDMDLLLVEASVDDRREEYLPMRRALRGLG